MMWRLQSRKLRKLAEVLTDAVVRGVECVALRDEVLEMLRVDTERREAQRRSLQLKKRGAAQMAVMTFQRHLRPG